jgi:hypothetical protein
MIKTYKLELESFVVILAAASLGVGVGYFTLHRSFFPSGNEISLPVVRGEEENSVSSTLVPSPTVSLPDTKVTSQISPDGAKLLTMSETYREDGSKVYSIVASDSDGGNTHEIYTVSASAGASMSIPFNAWSPDDRYVFVNSNDSKGVGAVVMRADGEPLTSEAKVFDVKGLFDAKGTGNIYQEATGWAASNLIIINTIGQNGEKGLSYWLEVPSSAIIPLSTQF